MWIKPNVFLYVLIWRWGENRDMKFEVNIEIGKKKKKNISLYNSTIKIENINIFHFKRKEKKKECTVARTRLANFSYRAANRHLLSSTLFKVGVTRVPGSNSPAPLSRLLLDCAKDSVRYTSLCRKRGILDRRPHTKTGLGSFILNPWKVFSKKKKKKHTY